MRYVAPAVDAVTGELLVPALSAAEFDLALRTRLGETWKREQPLIGALSAGARVRGVIERAASPDLGDPRAVGWTYLVAADDPDRDAIARVIVPLARQRGMADPALPLVFSGEPREDWQRWIEEEYSALNTGTPPHYILIVGGPDRIPFHFQAVLDSAASVGRVAFDDIASLENYVTKVLRLEAATEGGTRRQAMVFATDRGAPDPTYYSRRYMANPIESRLTALGVPVHTLYGPAATKADLLEALTAGHHALVYTATHGATRTRAELADQRRINGALVCTPEPGATAQSLFTARDLPADTDPVAEGAVIFAFACFSAGTPAHSDFSHWLGLDLPAGKADFVAALPTALLAHPRGPLAFIGHVDLAWLDAFDDENDPDIDKLWHPRLVPFLNAVETVLSPRPVGLGTAALSKRMDIGNYQLAVAFDRWRRGTPTDTEDPQKLARAFIARTDAQNYILLGDPAVYPRMTATQ